jgi:hypothetical protein
MSCGKSQLCPVSIEVTASLRTWSLWELMRIFQQRRLAHLLCDLQMYRDQCDEIRRKVVNGTVSSKPNETSVKLIIECLQDCEQLCEQVGWKSAKEKIGLINIHFKYKLHEIDYSSASADLRNAADSIMSEIWKRKYIEVHADLSDFVNNDVLFGTEVNNAYPSAKFDIREAGNCLAVEAGTAAVFHLMRAVEWGLRALCRHLGIYRTRRMKKSGKRKYAPIEYAQWEKMLDDVHLRVDANINKLGQGKRKQDLQQFYYPLLRDLKGFKDAWRNHVMHTRAAYEPKDAAAIFEHVKRFMSTLATKVSE